MAKKKAPAVAGPSSEKRAAAKPKASTAGSSRTGTKKTTAKATRSTKSTAARSDSTKGSTAAKKPTTDEQQLIADITALLPKLSEEELAFIKRQAEVIVATGELGRAREETIKAIEKISTKEAATSKRAAPPSQPAVGIEQKQDNAFFIRTYGKRIFFNRNEMRALAKACHAADNPSAGARRLHVWLQRERTDYLIDTGITGPGDPALRMLWEQMVETYAPPT